MQWRRATWSSQSSARGDHVAGTSRQPKRGDQRTTGEWIQIARLWTSEGRSLKGEHQKDYRTIDQGVTSNGHSQDAGHRPYNFQRFLYVAVWRRGRPRTTERVVPGLRNRGGTFVVTPLRDLPYDFLY